MKKILIFSLKILVFTVANGLYFYAFVQTQEPTLDAALIHEAVFNSWPRFLLALGLNTVACWWLMGRSLALNALAAPLGLLSAALIARIAFLNVTLPLVGFFISHWMLFNLLVISKNASRPFAFLAAGQSLLAVLLVHFALKGFFVEIASFGASLYLLATLLQIFKPRRWFEAVTSVYFVLHYVALAAALWV